ncbi:hypothetical protein B0H13DRAFT_1883768 [Mycena leptocephala]|nr:hypothetical protein B0H13DRAFT_1883768 [Mycena leptocephala]
MHGVLVAGGLKSALEEQLNGTPKQEQKGRRGPSGGEKEVVTAHCEVVEQAPQTAVMTSTIPVNSMRSIRRAKSEQRRHTPEIAVYIPRRSCIPPSVGDCHHPPSSSPHRHLFPEPTQSKATLTFNFTLFLSLASAPRPRGICGGIRTVLRYSVSLCVFNEEHILENTGVQDQEFLDGVSAHQLMDFRDHDNDSWDLGGGGGRAEVRFAPGEDLIECRRTRSTCKGAHACEALDPALRTTVHF